MGKLMDINKDGTLDKNDLRGAFDNVGVLMSESELDDLMGEVGGPCTFQGMVDMFQKQMAGDGNDPDELIIQAFSAYDKEAEIDDIFDEFEVDEDYMCKTKDVLGLFVAVKEDPEEDGDAKKKKKKKKKAAK